MDNEEAKFILRAYRRDGRDQRDPLFAEALEQARRDPALARWFEQEQRLDNAIANKMRSLVVPAGLKAAILAGGKASQPARRTHWQLAPVAAIIFALCIIAGSLWGPGRGGARINPLADYQTDMAAFLSGKFDLSFPSTDLTAVRGWFGENLNLKDYDVPPAIAAQLPTMGCVVIDWHGKKAGLICFRTSDGKMVHLIVLRRADMPDAPNSRAPQYDERGEWQTATWSAGDKIYLVASQVDQAALKALLKL